MTANLIAFCAGLPLGFWLALQRIEWLSCRDRLRERADHSRFLRQVTIDILAAYHRTTYQRAEGEPYEPRLRGIYEILP